MNNEQRAAELLPEDVFAKCRHERVAEIAAALDAAEARRDAVWAERLRLARRNAWNDGYDACRRGEQRHNPYRTEVASGAGQQAEPEAGR